MSAPLKILIAGGGAAGVFAAIAAAEARPGSEVMVCEATAQLLAKVRVSGGGRCNVTNACQDPQALSANYPRGGRELVGPLTRFGPRETVAWFGERGVALKTEPDGRMFPVTDQSTTIIDCLLRTASAAGVRLRLRCGVQAARAALGEPGFAVSLVGGTTVVADRLLIATGGTRGSTGLTIAEAFGHAIEPPVPSLFTFHIDDPRLRGLAGVSVDDAEAGLPGTKLSGRGPLLITHWGLSGPAILRLSAWAARELQAVDYRFALSINWAAPLKRLQVRDRLVAQRAEHPKRQVATANPFGLPGRLWEHLAAAAGLGSPALWARRSPARSPRRHWPSRARA